MRLLIAEDEKHLNKTLNERLTKAGYTVDSCFDGEDAVYYIENTQYDGIILDVMMPKINGFEVLRIIRERKILTPVLMLTAKDSDEDIITGLDTGANDYLTKPFATAELLARLRAMTRTQIAQVSSQLTFGNITLDQTSFELSSKSGSFRLANKEFQMIELLLRNPRQLIPTERFLEKIWGYDSDVELNVVWVYISYLRKKLAALHANIQIRATRNTGYSLEEIK